MPILPLGQHPAGARAALVAMVPSQAWRYWAFSFRWGLLGRSGAQSHD